MAKFYNNWHRKNHQIPKPEKSMREQIGDKIREQKGVTLQNLEDIKKLEEEDRLAMTKKVFDKMVLLKDDVADKLIENIIELSEEKRVQILPEKIEDFSKVDKKTEICILQIIASLSPEQRMEVLDRIHETWSNEQMNYYSGLVG